MNYFVPREPVERVAGSRQPVAPSCRDNGKASRRAGNATRALRVAAAATSRQRRRGLFLTVLAALVVVACGRQSQSEFTTLPVSASWLEALVESEPALAALGLSTQNSAATARSGWLLIEHGQRTADPGYFSFALLLADALSGVADFESESALLRGQSLLQLHRFDEAEQVARQLISRTELAAGYRLLGDSQLEQGKLGLAGEAYQRMLNLKPSPAAYGRAAEFSFRRGELERAVHLVEMALEGAARSDDSLVLGWTLTRAGHYLLTQGDHAAATRLLIDAQAVAPNPNASHLLALARLAGQQRELAIAGLIEVFDRYPSPTVGLLLLQLKPDAIDAATIRDTVAANGAQLDPRGYAHFLLSSQPGAAETGPLLELELAQRRDSATLTLAAWHALDANRPTQARALIDESLASGSPDPLACLIATRVDLRLGAQQRARQRLGKCRVGQALLFPQQRRELESLRAALAVPVEPLLAFD